MARKCYVCGREATSREHVPPRCFFPDDSRYRQQLITVRSCTEHNEDTSLDDEYVRNVIAMCIGNNSIGFKQFIEKTVKSFEGSIGLMKKTVGTSQTVFTPEGPTRAFKIDRARFNKVMKKIAYGLYFYKFREPWNRDLTVATRNVKTQDMSENDYGLIQWAEANCPPLPSQGKNPKVFQYNIIESNKNTENTAFRIVFYENFVVWVIKLKGSQTFEI